jgi:hypothetical protein
MNVIKFVRNRTNVSNPYQDLDGSHISGLDASIKQECDEIFGDYTDKRTETNQTTTTDDEATKSTTFLKSRN